MRRFYELSVGTLEQQLPILLYKIYEKLHKDIYLLLENEQQVEAFDRLLWVFSSNKFLPHGTKKDDKEHRKNIYISSELDINSQYKLLITNQLLDNQPNFLKNFEQHIHIFLLKNNQKFLDKYHFYKNNNEEIEYWGQDAQGKWFCN